MQSIVLQDENGGQSYDADKIIYDAKYDLLMGYDREHNIVFTFPFASTLSVDLSVYRSMPTESDRIAALESALLEMGAKVYG